MIYVMGAFSKGGTDDNVELIQKHLQFLWKNDIVGFSPVEAFHRQANSGHYKDSYFWMELCQKFMPICSEFHVVAGYINQDLKERVEGSIGIMAELGYANLYNIPVKYYVYADNGNYEAFSYYEMLKKIEVAQSKKLDYCVE